ncbi:TIGR03086 family metal-binding protein [Saccharopolyspora sp. K220]|uniref:TIGR03086 family metal-binding protein n=1 Tax=Saccharopolyspora soli TaxID=2926618 RepID=UPI001F583B2C|nr:TIGR03086 family metal-binding protein [Saccharopolyspora soli]MCI2423361.1 TIGR03086 family metal-binding protein [Saccharopolyspora soli]
MSDAQFLARAAAALAGIIRDTKPDQLDARTPCTEYDVRGLVNHLLFWGPSLEGAGRKETVPPPDGAEADVDLTGGDWAAALEAHLDRTVAAWSEPGAWEGTTHMGGPTELPASLVGGMVVVELVVHGWDLAKGTGQTLALDDDLVAYVHDEVEKTAAQGRQMGVYGAEIEVPQASSTLDRTLARTGRNPIWNP